MKVRTKSNVQRGQTDEGSREHGFTIVELLIVIAIVSLLASLLLPTLQRARETAIATVCKSNIKQTLMGCTQYADDNSSYYPPVCVNYSSFTWKGVTRNDPWIPWYSAMLMGAYVGNETICASAYSPYEQVPTAKSLLCPKGKRNYKGTSLVQTWIGYNNSDWPYNRFTSQINYKNDPPGVSKTYKPITQGRNHARLLVFADVRSGNSWGKLGVADNQISYRHLDAANIGFMDQHVSQSSNLEAAKSLRELEIVLK